MTSQAWDAMILIMCLDTSCTLLCCEDKESIYMRCRKFFRLVDRYVAEEGESKKKARLEAAAKLGANHQRVLDDILKNSGILRVSQSHRQYLILPSSHAA